MFVIWDDEPCELIKLKDGAYRVYTPCEIFCIGEEQVKEEIKKGNMKVVSEKEWDKVAKHFEFDYDVEMLAQTTDEDIFSLV